MKVNNNLIADENTGQNCVCFSRIISFSNAGPRYMTVYNFVTYSMLNHVSIFHIVKWNCV